MSGPSSSGLTKTPPVVCIAFCRLTALTRPDLTLLTLVSNYHKIFSLVQCESMWGHTGVVLTHGCGIMRQRFDQHKAQRVAIIQEGIRAHGLTNMAVPVGVIENVDAQSLPNGKQAQMELFRNCARRCRSQQGPPIRGACRSRPGCMHFILFLFQLRRGRG